MNPKLPPDSIIASAYIFATALAAGPAMADPLNVQAVMVSKEQIKLDFTGLKGAGTLHIKFANPTDRVFILDGNLAAAQP